MPAGLQIGEVARATGLGVHAIRFYEREGLLKEPVRSDGGYRLFDQENVRDLIFIRGAQELGFSLSEIRELLVLRRSTSQPCSHVHELLGGKLEAVEAKIRELEKLRGELRLALQKCRRDLKRVRKQTEQSCPVLEELSRWGTGPKT